MENAFNYDLRWKYQIDTRKITGFILGDTDYPP